MNTLANKHILLGITGGIAAYKSAELVRRLREQDAIVRVVMTTAATEFITPLTLQTLSEQRVYTELLDVENEARIGHIELARWAEVVLIAPATANFITKLSYGHADDLLSTLCLATSAPIILAPAMNQQMWNAAVVQENCQRLQNRGVQLFGPASGMQACGEVGEGRLLEPVEIVKRLQLFFSSGALQGHRVLITAGPTREDIDPVRFISNRSSGRMGYAIAKAALAIGAEVILVSGPVSLPRPSETYSFDSSLKFIQVYSAQDMFDAVMANVETADIFISTAAVADYRPLVSAQHKMKKSKGSINITLEPTSDILAHVATLPKPPFTVGFAAETQETEEYARIKLQSKKLDMIAANQVGLSGDIGFDSEYNALTILWEDGKVILPRALKSTIAEQLLELVIQRFKRTARI